MSKDDQTGAVTVPTEVSQDETFYTTRRDYGLMVNGIDRLGHHDIEQHQVRPEAIELHKRLFAVRSHLDRVPLQLEVDLEELLDDLIVINDQDASVGHAGTT